MSRRRLEFEKYAIKDLAIAAKEAWTRDMPIDNLSDLDKEDYERLVKGLVLVENYVECVDPDMLPPLNWNEFAQHLNAIRSEGEIFQKQGGEQHLTRAMSSFDAILSRYVVIRSVFVSRKYAKSFNASLSKMTECIGEQLETLASKKDELLKLTADLHGRISSLIERYDREEQKISLQVQQHQEQFSQAQEKRQSEYAAAQEKRQEKFRADEAARDKEFKDWTVQCAKGSEDVRSRIESDFAEMTKQLDDEAKSFLSQMEEIKKKTERIYGIVGKESVVGSQKAYADKAKQFAHGLFAMSAALMIIVAVIVILPLLSVLGDATKISGTDWIMLACRVPVTAVLLLPAFYLANEAKKQREKENYYRELEIKLSAVSPYFASISEKQESELPEKDRVMMELAKGMLAIHDQKEDHNAVLSPDVIEFAKCVSSIVKNNK